MFKETGNILICPEIVRKVSNLTVFSEHSNFFYYTHVFYLHTTETLQPFDETLFKICQY